MKLIIDIPEQMYLNAKADTLCGAGILVSAIKNGIPHETVTEFADRCRECGKMRKGHWIEHNTFNNAEACYLECSECGYITYQDEPNYCEDCGAKMVEQESEDSNG